VQVQLDAVHVKANKLDHHDLLADGVHLNRKGQMLMALIYEPSVRRSHFACHVAAALRDAKPGRRETGSREAGTGGYGLSYQITPSPRPFSPARSSVVSTSGR